MRPLAPRCESKAAMRHLALLRPSQYRSTHLRLARELAIGLLCGACAIFLRALIDIWAPEVSPFALVYPLILVGTLYGHCSAGLVAGALTFLWGWWHSVPPSGTFEFSREMDAALISIHAASAVVTLIFALAFRRTIKTAIEERDREIARASTLMREIEHRTKNNFAIIVSMLQSQKREESDPRITRALDLARARINSFARAYANLAESAGGDDNVAMKTYLAEVVSNFANGGFPENVTIEVDACDCVLPRKIAVGIGLFVNEALTNAAKHAFPNDRPGRVEVRLNGTQARWELLIEDNGVGFDPDSVASASGGTGSKLMEAFAKQAQASFTIQSSSNGTCLHLASDA